MNHCQDRNRILEKKWIGQSIRFNRKLLPEYFRIDEKTLADFSRFAAEYGKQISYFNFHNRPDGDWAPFFRDDPTICLLFLQSLDTESWTAKAAEMLQLVDKTKDEGVKLSALKSLVAMSSGMFAEIEQSVSNIHVYASFYEQLKKYITNRLSHYFLIVTETSRKLDKEFKWRNPSVANFTNEFGDYWRYGKAFTFPETKDWAKDITLTIGQNIYKIIHDIELLKKETEVFLNTEVLTEGNIKPHIALFIAFSDLYYHAQKKLNHISERHLVHYFYNILGMAPMKGNSDSLYLNFITAAGSGSLELDTNTQFNYAVTEDGTPVYFELTQPLSIHEGSIKQVAGVNLSDTPWKGSFMDLSQGGTAVFDLKEVDARKENAVIGFEVASQFLVLEEGDRRITFDFYLSRIESIRLKEKINNRYFAYSIEKLNELISNGWSCFYSSEPGMMPVEENSLQVFFKTGTDPDRLILRFDVLLKRYELPLISPDPENPEGDAILKFVLTPKGLDVYNIFRDLGFSDPKLNIAVIGIKNLIIQNEFGVFENDRPFEPFGSKPIIGSSLYIGHKNLFLKPLKELIINLEWHDLPDDRGGFKTYYKDYTGIDNNSSFKARLSHLVDKTWLPLENKQVVDLFTGVPSGSGYNNDAISLIRRMNEIDVPSMALDTESRILGPIKEYDIASTDGFIRMELCYPDVCFGHDEYPELLQREAFRSVKEKKEPKIINAPYTPSLKNISLEYKANIEVGQWGEKISFKKLHPFGSEEVKGPGNWAILPYFPEGGSFFIGLDPLLSAKEISLLFRISNQSSRYRDDNVEGFALSVLDQANWQPLAPDKITGDSTQKLQQTGILKIQLPEMQVAPNVYDGQSIWLRFDLKDMYTGVFIENIHLNAGLATRDHYLDVYSKPVPEHTIKELTIPVVQIEAVEQHYPSFGGRNPESEDLFRFRVSERIRHKARAVSTRDMEALLLAQFPEIQSLKCLSHLNTEFAFQPGAITVVVIPGEHEVPDALERYFPKEQLMRMQNYLNQRALSGMKISVINPVYEKIRLKFHVRFRKGYDERLSVKRLHQRIMDFLDPWKSRKIITLGGAIPVTTILNAIELEDYVDFVTNFSAFHIVDGQIINVSTAQSNNMVIKPKYPVSVLIPDNNHKLLSFNDAIATDKPGINDMMIGNDFLISMNLANADAGLGFDRLEKTFRVPAQSGDTKTGNDTFTLYLKD
ncbi:MAG: hypothetical protein K0S33_1746 [Bacteroidetes bacterium]|jgi:hypothetical protein|nr:hypothetical protein [Bacteroidota bacterium]